MNIGAIILAAGKGNRFGGDVPKQFLLLREKKIYQYPMDLILQSNYFKEILLVSQPTFLPYISPIYHPYFIPGAGTRKGSVYKGLCALKNVDYVMIFDGARPFLTNELIEKHIQELKKGALGVNTCIPAEDTINIGENNKIIHIPKRDLLFHGQTPQSFHLKTLIDCHKRSIEDFSDDCSIFLENKKNVQFVVGHKTNIKITTPIDLTIAELFLK